MTHHQHVFLEELHVYQADELAAWKSGNDEVVNRLVEQSGPMSRGPRTYINQAAKARQNYPEVKYGAHLVTQRGCDRGSIAYENYVLSLEAYLALGCSTLAKKATTRLQDVLSTAFFEEFDRLLKCNRIQKASKHMQVDMCAWWIEQSRVELVEIKKYEPGASKTEKVEQHQLQTLALAKHAADTLESRAFVAGYGIFESKIIAFAEENDVVHRKIAPVAHEITILG